MGQPVKQATPVLAGPLENKHTMFLRKLAISSFKYQSPQIHRRNSDGWIGRFDRHDFKCRSRDTEFGSVDAEMVRLRPKRTKLELLAALAGITLTKKG